VETDRFFSPQCERKYTSFLWYEAFYSINAIGAEFEILLSMVLHRILDFNGAGFLSTAPFFYSIFLLPFLLMYIIF